MEKQECDSGKQTKLLTTTIILITSVFAVQIVNAVPAAPSSTCEITANVLMIEKTRTDIKGRGMPPREDFDYYKVSLDILDISTYKQEGGRSCDNSYIELAEQSDLISTLAEYNKNPISEGQKIKAKINFSGDEWFSGYFLSDIQILEDITILPGEKEDELSYWYYIIPAIITLLAVIFYILFKKRKQ